jgi:hypothetical protein
MRKWLVISAAGAVVGYVAVYFALDRKPTPQPQPEPPAVAAAEPVVLKDVVDVTNVEALLDARPAEPAGVPFDAADAPGPSAPTAVAPIPMAAD